MGQSWEDADNEAKEAELAMASNAGERVVDHQAIKRIWRDDGFRIFLSHRSKVKKDVGELKDRLEAFGARCFVAHENIQPMLQFQNEMLKALDSMHCLMAVITDKFHESVWTGQEIGYALARRVPIISLKLSDENPRGFTGRDQALSCRWETAPVEALKIAIKYPDMFNAYVEALRSCRSFDNGNHLGKLLPGMMSLSDAQANALVEVYNSGGEIAGSFAFTGGKAREYGPGLLQYLRNL